LINILDELSEYAAYHFKTEEDVWHQIMPGDEWEKSHKHSHDEFLINVLKLTNTENSKPLNQVLEDLLVFLMHWLTMHILDSDMRMSKVVLAVQAGVPLEQAKQQANQELSLSTEILVETVLSLNNRLSTKTLELMKEVLDRRRSEARLILASKDLKNKFVTMHLTGRELEIMKLVVAGFTSKEIALHLGIAFRTVEHHRAHIMKKTGASNLIDLVHIYDGTE
jgi:hemerythrin-like metal-binding protein